MYLLPQTPRVRDWETGARIRVVPEITSLRLARRARRSAREIIRRQIQCENGELCSPVEGNRCR